MKIALVCTNLGYTRRGFERFSAELFDLVKADIPITLFGCQPNGRDRTVSLPCLKHDGLLKILKARERNHYYFQQLSYALSFIPWVALGRYDIVHYSEPAMGNFLFHARRFFGFRYKLLFTDGLGLDPNSDKTFFERSDHIQTITLPHYQKSIQCGVEPSKVSFIPYGVVSNRYSVKRDKNTLRDKYEIPNKKIVILTVAALNRRHKRIDYLIQEVNHLGKDYFLLIVGQPEEPDLIALGHETLKGNFKALYVSFDQVSEIYHLADLFVFPCLTGEFGLALAEAMCVGLPAIAHFHFKWMVGDFRCLVDLREKGALARKIEKMVRNYEMFKQIAVDIQARAIKRFDWAGLKPRYLEMYEKVMNSGERMVDDPSGMLLDSTTT